MTFPLWAWLTFAALVLVLLFLDLFVFHRGAREVPFGEAMWLSGFWIAISLAFGGLVWFIAGPQVAGEYLAVYLIEKSPELPPTTFGVGRDAAYRGRAHRSSVEERLASAVPRARLRIRREAYRQSTRPRRKT